MMKKTLMDLWKRILESLGYTVTAKNSSLEALETFQKSPDIFDMVITDQTMPHNDRIQFGKNEYWK